MENRAELENQSPKTIVTAPKKRGWKGLILILIVVILAGGFLYRNSQKGAVQNTNDNNEVVISEADIKKDFVDGEKRTQQEVVPPENIVERYTGIIDKSLAAIKNNQPSSQEFKDLSEDYLTVASSYNILGDFAKAEEAYQKMLQAFPDDYKANLNLAELHATMHQYQQAGQQYLAVIKKYPADYRVYGKLADLYYNYANLDEAVKIQKASLVYEWGIKNADDKKELYKNYSFFAENYAHDYAKAAGALREYQKITGSVEEQEIERLEQMIETK